jgi:hypothetical protein
MPTIEQLEQQYVSACIIRSRQWLSMQSAPPDLRIGIETAYLEARAAEESCLAELQKASAEAVKSWEEVA